MADSNIPVETDDGSEAAGAPPAGITASLETLSNPELTSVYLHKRQRFRELVTRVERISRGSGGIPAVDFRMYWAAILFTRICVTAKSASKLMADPRPGELWDFSALASIVRNLLEVTMVYNWLCGGRISEEQRAARLLLFQLHDYGSRKRLFPDDYPENDPVFEDLKRRFDLDPILSSLPAGQRRNALCGEKTPFVQDDVLLEMGSNLEDFRLLYRFLSQHTHSGPVSFYRMQEHVRGTGVETRHEKLYSLIAIDSATLAIDQLILEHLVIFPDAETRAPHLTRKQIELNVEVQQGRRRPKRERHRA
ncbi:DUF5677 domain-containing protein [Rhizobium leguminosarum]